MSSCKEKRNHLREHGKMVLILGGGVMQLPAIRTAKERGWHVVVADGNDAAPGAGIAHRFLHIDLKDKEALAEAAEGLLASGLQGIFTAGTDFSPSVAYAAEKCGLPGIPYQSALRAKDKILMRECFRKQGIPSPHFIEAHTEDDLRKAAECLDFPLVVKPTDNMGARGVKKIENADELAAAFRTAMAIGISRKVIIEEFIPGPEFSLDALVHNGRVDICGFADRHIFFPPYFVEMGHTMPTSLPEDDQQRIIEVFERGIRALGITEGAAKGDIKLSPDGPMVGEIAARLSGGYMSGWTYPYAAGHEVTESALEIALGEEPSQWHSGYSMASAERAFISIPGRIRQILGLRDAFRLLHVKNLFTCVSPGDEVCFPRNNVEKCGNIITQAPDAGTADCAAEHAVSRITLILEPGNSLTERFVFMNGEPWIPSVFHLQNKENVRAYERMADIVEYDGSPFLMLPALDTEDQKDWHGLSLEETVRRIGKLRCHTGRKGYTGGKIFWDALLRGGLQAGIWVLDTLETAASEGSDGREIVEKWKRQ